MPVRFYAFAFLVVSAYAIDVDAADSGADGADAAFHVETMARAGIGMFGEMVDKDGENQPTL